MIRALCLCLCLLWMCCAAALGADDAGTHTWGVGLQGNAPLWGGLSVKYMGLGKVHIQAVEHYTQHGDGDQSLMFGAQTPIIVAEHPGMNIFVAPAFGYRREKSGWETTVFDDERIDPGGGGSGAVAHIRYEESEVTLGGAFSVGTELFLDRLLGLETRSRYGVSIQFGQAVGRIKHERTYDTTTEDASGNPANLADYPRLDKQVKDFTGQPFDRAQRDDGSRASLTVGFAFHIYF